MKKPASEIFSLTSISHKTLKEEGGGLNLFEGPLTYLIQLIQKNEIDICEVPIRNLTLQYLEKIQEMKISSVMEKGTEFMDAAAFLLWMKSRTLLPKHGAFSQEEEAFDPNFEIIYKLIDYCRFKEVAKILTEKEKEQETFHARGSQEILECKKGFGIEHLEIQDLKNLFLKVLEKGVAPAKRICEEPWRVADKIGEIKARVLKEKKLEFCSVFHSKMGKTELIVMFLAVLELVKIGEISIEKEPSGTIYLFQKEKR